MAKEIITKLRQTRANMLGTEDEEHYSVCHQAADELEKMMSREADYLEMLLRQAATIKAQWKMMKVAK